MLKYIHSFIFRRNVLRVLVPYTANLVFGIVLHSAAAQLPLKFIIVKFKMAGIKTCCSCSGISNIMRRFGYVCYLMHSSKQHNERHEINQLSDYVHFLKINK